MQSDRPEMIRFMPWPFADHVFPRELGAVVQRSVLDGTRPALVVVHSGIGDWAIGDGIDDPNVPGACVATHIWHAIEHNSSVAQLADLAPGDEARRRSPTDPWVITTADIPD